MTDELTRQRFFNSMMFADRERDNNSFFIECDYGSVNGTCIQHAVNQDWVEIHSMQFMHFITIKVADQNEENSRYKYELKLTETGEALYDFYQL